MNEVFWTFGELSAIQAESASRDLQFQNDFASRAGRGFLDCGWLTHTRHMADTHPAHTRNTVFVMNEVFWRFGELSAIQAESATRDLQF